MRYVSAIRAASIAAAKQSDGDAAAITGTGLSELRPKSTISRSACSGFVGMPVDGPARWMSRIEQRQLERHPEPDGLGLQHDRRARPRSSRRAQPPNAAPRAAPQAAISSSA